MLGLVRCGDSRGLAFGTTCGESEFGVCCSCFFGVLGSRVMAGQKFGGGRGRSKRMGLFFVSFNVYQVTHIARVWINRVRLPILHVVS